MSKNKQKSDMTVISDMIKDFKRKESPFINLRIWENLRVVLNAAVANEQFVPFTPMGKHLIEAYSPEVDSERVPNNGVPIKAEAYAIWKMIRIGLDYYGEPIFEYDLSGNEERYEDVDFWRNLIKVGREVGPNGGEKRVEAVEALRSPERGTFISDPKTLKIATDNLVRTYVGSTYSEEYISRSAEYSISSSTTNAGEWTYARKSRIIDGFKVRDIMRRDVKNLSHDWAQYSYEPAFLGARSQRGKWEILVKDIEAADWLKKNCHLNEKDFVNKFVKEVRFTNIKNRVIAAAPGNFSLFYAPLGFASIQAEKRRVAPAQIHLDGPKAIKEHFLNLKYKVIPEVEAKVGLKALTYNGDIHAMDSQIIDKHFDEVYYLKEKTMPKYDDKRVLRLALMSSLVRDMLYIRKPVKNVTELKANLCILITSWYLKSGEPVTNDGGSSSTELQMTKSRIRVSPVNWVSIMDIGVKHQTAVTVANGDDNHTIYFVGADGTISEDLLNTTNDMENKNGLIFKDPTYKGEAGYFYNQFRLTPDDRFNSPITRIREFHKESHKESRGPYLECIDYYMNFEFRYDCKPGVAKRWITDLRLPYDKTQIGTVDIATGKRLTYPEFKAKIHEEAIKYNKGRTFKEILFKGNPYDERVLNKDGTINDDWLSDQWHKMYKLIHD